MSDLAALEAETKRLRASLRATRRVRDTLRLKLTRLSAILLRADDLATEAERAAVVAWLRVEANAPHPIEAGERALSPSGRGLLLLAAIRIERGEHRREGDE